jgi:hypothetical protein
MNASTKFLMSFKREAKYQKKKQEYLKRNAEG